jgi:hypothetical protein
VLGALGRPDAAVRRRDVSVVATLHGQVLCPSEPLGGGGFEPRDSLFRRPKLKQTGECVGVPMPKLAY